MTINIHEPCLQWQACCRISCFRKILVSPVSPLNGCVQCRHAQGGGPSHGKPPIFINKSSRNGSVFHSFPQLSLIPRGLLWKMEYLHMFNHKMEIISLIIRWKIKRPSPLSLLVSNGHHDMIPMMLCFRNLSDQALSR